MLPYNPSVIPTEHKIAVQVEGIVKSFGTEEARVLALRGANFEARYGELIMLVGPSGCGKTTLLSIICGTLHGDEGRVRVFDHELTQMSDSEITRFRGEKVGFIFQQFNLIPTLNLVENVSIPLILIGKKPAASEKRAEEILELVGLGGRLKSYPRQLSGGQQQRVAIARALVHDPQLVICDEPTAALDATTGHKVLDLLKEIAYKPDRCVIVVTHDSRIYNFADRIAEMEDGQIKNIHLAGEFLHV